MRRTLTPRLLGALLCGLTLAACTPRGPIRAAGAEEGTEAGRRNAAVLIAADLADYILVERSGMQTTPAGTAEVSFVIQNGAAEAQQVESRVHFFDADDGEAEPPSAWQRTHLSPNSFATVRERSMTAQPFASYFIEIR
jgi:hypothetical protein